MAITAPAAKPARARTRSKSRREDMLNEAARQLNRTGPSLTSLKDIASALGVTRRALYHYVEDREDLVYQCYVRSCEVILARLAEATAAGGDGQAILGRWLELTLGPDQPELAAVTEAGLLPEPKRGHVQGLYDELVAAISTLLAKGMKAGNFRRCDCEVAARAILGVVFWLPLTSPWSSGLPDQSREMELAVAKDFLLFGWAARRKPLPAYVEIDLASISVPSVDAFDREALAEAKREKILATASRLFNRKGIDTTTLEEIAGELGATPRAIYHHVGDKQTLVAQCYFRMMKMAQRLQAAAYSADESAIAGGAAFHHAWALAQMRDDIAPLTPMTGFSALAPADQAQFRDYARQLTEVAIKHVEDGMAQGDFRDLDLTALRLHAGASGWLAKTSVSDPLQQQHAARELAGLITLGLAPLDKT